MLVNDRSIFIDRSITSYIYYHVELAEHGILLAENLPTESYLDTGNRGNFANAGLVAMTPSFGVDANCKNWANAAAPLTVRAACVAPIWQMLNARAQLLGMPRLTPAPVLCDDPEIRLVRAGGAVIRPVRQNGDRYIFMVRPGAGDLRLVSRAGRPSEIIGPYIDDRRMLGVLVGEIAVHAGRRRIKADGHLICPDLPGWFSLDDAAHRWTDGNATLPVALDPRCAHAAVLEIQIVQAGPYQIGQEITETGIAA
jgi:hypothetical protein